MIFSTLSLTIAYHRYQHGNHDPDHDPCQEAEEDEEDEADDHGYNQSPAKRRYGQFKENLFAIQTELTRMKKESLLLTRGSSTSNV